MSIFLSAILVFVTVALLLLILEGPESCRPALVVSFGLWLVLLSACSLGIWYLELKDNQKPSDPSFYICFAGSIVSVVLVIGGFLIWIDGPEASRVIAGKVFVYAMLLLPFSMIVNWYGVCGVRGPKHPIAKNRKESNEAAQKMKSGYDSMTSEAKSLLFEEYSTVTEHIKNDVSHQRSLFELRFMVAGAILVLLINPGLSRLLGILGESNDGQKGIPPKAQAILLWSAIAVSSLMDIYIQYGSQFMSILGGWNRSLEARVYGMDAIVGWETYLAANGPFNTWSWPFMMLALHAFTLILYEFAIALRIFRPMMLQREVDRIDVAGALGIAALFCYQGFLMVSLNPYDILRIVSGFAAALLLAMAVVVLRREKNFGGPIGGTLPRRRARRN